MSVSVGRTRRCRLLCQQRGEKKGRKGKLSGDEPLSGADDPRRSGPGSSSRWVGFGREKTWLQSHLKADLGVKHCFVVTGLVWGVGGEFLTEL